MDAMSTDRELLELAAKAAGYEVARESDTDRGLLLLGVQHVWNPLINDGDAMRLSVKLQIQVTPGTYNKDEFVAYSPMHVEAREHWSQQTDEYAATRRAIVRVAAELARSI